MRDLICGYCGGLCGINSEAWGPSGETLYCTECANGDCMAQGPYRTTSELAAAAHATVTPALRWDDPPAQQGGKYWIERTYANGSKSVFDCYLKAGETPYPNCRISGPIPLPLEPGEGGGA